VNFAVTESDPIFDDHVSITATLHASQNSESISPGPAVPSRWFGATT
jgi:hypothetical protein